eukprot:scaffold21543_cov30-Phaeocystis_antarctica.AAC.1
MTSNEETMTMQARDTGPLKPSRPPLSTTPDVLHVDQAPPPLWSRHSPSNGPCMTRSWSNIGLLACRRV